MNFTYDEVGNLTQFENSNSHITGYDYDNFDRLLTITYPDSTTKAFTYTPAGDLNTYTDNQSRTRTMTYDDLHRLTNVAFSDSTQMQFAYDSVGNLLSLVDRNSNKFVYLYDSLYRPVANQAFQGSSLLWAQSSTFDANSNRIALYTDPAVYGTAHYGTDRYLTGTALWTLPLGGYDEMDRLRQFHDRNGNLTTLGYDNESRRT